MGLQLFANRLFGGLRPFVRSSLAALRRTHAYTTTAADGRLLLGFTCKVCNQRTHKTMSKQAYTQGVVLMQCGGCNNRHLIADNLQWFTEGSSDGQRKDPKNIEEIAQMHGIEIKRSVQGTEGDAVWECLRKETNKNPLPAHKDGEIKKIDPPK